MGKGYLPLQTARPALGPTKPLLCSGFRGSFIGAKRPGREGNRLPPSSAEVKKNEWSYASATLICLHGVERHSLTLSLRLIRVSLESDRV